MTRIEIEEEKTVTRKKLLHEVCDWCGRKSLEHREFNDSVYHDDDKPAYIYDINEFHLSWQYGRGYPDGGDTEELSIDLCNSCRQRLFDLLEEQGAKIKREEISF